MDDSIYSESDVELSVGSRIRARQISRVLILITIMILFSIGISIFIVARSGLNRPNARNIVEHPKWSFVDDRAKI